VAEAKTISILELDFSCSMPYDAGHTINEAEAKVLNQTRRENLGNNFREKVREHKETGTPTLEELTAAFADLDLNYVFTLANVASSRKLDPVEREARSLARTYLKAELEKAGRKITQAPDGVEDDEWKAVIESEVERIAADEAIVKMAKDAVKARSKISGITVGTSLVTPQ
jgi:hypothetical protein